MNLDIVGIIVVLVVILFSMVLHELAHGLVALWLGDDSAKEEGRLTLNPVKHLDPVMSIMLPLLLYITGGPVFGGAKPVPINPSKLKWREWGMALVAFAGPLTNFLIALISFLIGFWTGWLNDQGVLGLIFTELVIANLGFAVFNMIPIPPLDGSRILYALSPDGVRDFMEKMESVGLIVVYIMILVFGSVFQSVMVGGISGILDFFYLLVGIS
ncbi:site-2 protease family protein [Candidatus Saccharibacteria bacterium]|nr:site-2 protease family protein [Candidatus Saccharibacteria bacterium]